MSKKVAYYARPISLYGTKQEYRDIVTIKALGYTIFDSKSERVQEEYRKYGMSIFLDMVKICDVLFFRSFQDGKIGAGVYKEISAAEVESIPVIELPTITSHRILSIPDTRTYLELLGVR